MSSLRGYRLLHSSTRSLKKRKFPVPKLFLGPTKLYGLQRNVRTEEHKPSTPSAHCFQWWHSLLSAVDGGMIEQQCSLHRAGYSISCAAIPLWFIALGQRYLQSCQARRVADVCLLGVIHFFRECSSNGEAVPLQGKRFETDDAVLQVVGFGTKQYHTVAAVSTVLHIALRAVLARKYGETQNTLAQTPFGDQLLATVSQVPT